MVEWNGGNKMMADVRTNDVVEEMCVDEAEIAINGGCCAAGKGPGVVVVVGHACIGVLEESDCNCFYG